MWRRVQTSLHGRGRRTSNGTGGRNPDLQRRTGSWTACSATSRRRAPHPLTREPASRGRASELGHACAERGPTLCAGTGARIIGPVPWPLPTPRCAWALAGWRGDDPTSAARRSPARASGPRGGDAFGCSDRGRIHRLTSPGGFARNPPTTIRRARAGVARQGEARGDRRTRGRRGRRSMMGTGSGGPTSDSGDYEGSSLISTVTVISSVAGPR